MSPEAMDVEIGTDAGGAYEQLREARRQTLAAPEDDMWATFADLAVPHSLTVDGRSVGRFSVDAEQQLHAFFVDDELDHLALDLLARVVAELEVVAAMASTVDPRFLALSLTAGGAARPVALLYDHVAAAESEESVEVRVATGADHQAAVAFGAAATGAPDAFLVPYLGERIELGELYLVEADGSILASGECRVDRRSAGHAHLGLMVAADLRSQGLGGRLMHTLTGISLDQGLRPLCSTEPTNLASQRVIRRSGFRSRHQVLRVALPADGQAAPRRR